MTDKLWNHSKNILLDNGYDPTDWVSIVDFYNSQGGGAKRLYAYIDPENPFRVIALLNSQEVVVLYSKSGELGLESYHSVLLAKKRFVDSEVTSEIEMELPEGSSERIDSEVSFQLDQSQKYILVRS